MTYTYRNKKTGEEIVTSNKVTGKNWEPVDEEPLYPFEDEEVFDEDPAEEAGEGIPVEEAPAEEAPPPKAKSSRKGKK